MAWNNRSIFFNDARVRRAMTHMVRREEVLQTHRYGLGKVLSGPFYYYSKGYNHDIAPLPYDPKEAVRLLEEAGWKDHDHDGVLDREIDGKTRRFEFTLLSPTGIPEYQEALLLSFQEDLKKLGIILNLQKLEWSALLQRSNQREYDALINGFRPYPLFEDPYEKWHSSLADAEGANNNKACYGCPEVDRLVERIRTEFDDAKRYELLHEVHACIHRDQPFTCLYSLASLVGINKRWRNVKIHKTGVFLYEWWLPPENLKPSDQVDL
ncbi:MAG: hypothetical protein KJ645_03630 [Planctomycetes bacterium]|nr:hypothetical protein [Planctomycetota bacterium]